jgi:hypothetical protein
MIVALPLASVVAAEAYPPPERVMVPVGVAPLPETVTVTLRLLVETTVLAAGFTVMVAWSGRVTVSCAVPEAEL